MKTRWDPDHQQLYVYRHDPNDGESWWDFVALIRHNELFLWQRQEKGMQWVKQDIKFESLEDAMRYAETLAAMGELK